MNDGGVIENYLKRKDQEWEALCLRCGACCGAYDDPCLHLKKDTPDTYTCEIYPERLGMRKSLAGNTFRCVPFKDIAKSPWTKDHLCPCKKKVNTPWLLSL